MLGDDDLMDQRGRRVHDRLAIDELPLPVVADPGLDEGMELVDSHLGRTT